MRTGENIRRIRSGRGIELQRLASVLGLDAGYLSAVEACQSEPSVPELLRIARALDTDISALIYGKEFEARQAIVTRKKERLRIARAKSYDYESLAPQYAGRHIEPLEVTILPDTGERRPASSHIGEEFHYVIEGRLKIAIDGAVHILEAGDTIYFDSSLPHELYGVGGPARIVAMLYNGESMIQLTRSHRMRDIIQAAKHVTEKKLALVCPNATSLEAVNKALEENVLESVWLFGDRGGIAPEHLRHEERCRFFDFDSKTDGYHASCAAAAVAAVRAGGCQMLMKGDINTSIFLKAVLNREHGIGTGRRLSMVSVFELPRLDRLIFLTDPAINPFLTQNNDLNASRDIILNAIEAARGMGVDRPKVALLDANEMPSEAVPTTLNARHLSEIDWENADVYGPLSYDLALYMDAVEHKGIKNNPVAGRADILIVPYLSSGNFLYKAWAMTMAAEVANVVIGAQVPIIITSRADSDMTKFLTICACAVYGRHLRGAS